MDNALQQKISSFLLTILIFILANQVWSSGGYINLYTEASTWLLIILGFVTVFLALFINRFSLKIEYVLFLITLLSVILFIIGYYHDFPQYGTDEIAIDYCAANLTIHGINPYTYKYEIVPNKVLPYFITPTVYGGYVDTLKYPALSFLLQIPFVLLNLPSDFLLITFNLLSYILVFLYFRKRNVPIIPSILALIFLVININWIFYSIGGVTDIVWTDLFALSYIYREKPIVSSILLGLAISFKQTPLILVPFFLYFLYRDVYNSVYKIFNYMITAISVFIITNLPFIISSPLAWFDSVAGIGMQPILGVGLGISALEYTGIIHVGKMVFYVLPAIVFLSFFYIYIIYYPRLKYTFPAYPILIFFFYDRLLLSYLIYWPFLALIMLPDSFTSNYEKTKINVKKLLPIFLMLLALSGFLFTSDYTSPVQIISAKASDPLLINNAVTEITLTVYYNPQPGDPSCLPMNFRIFPYYPSPHSGIQTNGLLWVANQSLHPGLNIISIYPRTFVDLLPYNDPYAIEGYYGDIRAFFYGNFNNSVEVAFQNPYLALPEYTYSMKEYPYGWYFGPNTQAGNATFRYKAEAPYYSSFNYKINEPIYKPGILTLYAIKNENKQGWAASQMIDPSVNITYLGLNNYIYKFKISNISSNISNVSIVINGYPYIFYGIEITNGIDQIWIGYSNISNEYQSNPNLFIILENSTTITVNFNEIYQIAKDNFYDFSDVDFLFLVGTTIKGYVSATFSGYELYQD